MVELLVLVRHAESTRNAAKQGRPFFPDDDAAAPFRGQPDRATPLTDAGRLAARDLGEQLRARFGAFDVVVDSGYRRTVDTASLILEAWPETQRSAVTRRSVPLLRERDTGYTVNMTDTEAAKAFPWLQSYWAAEGPLHGRPPGGESLVEVAERVRGFVERDLPGLAGRRVLVVSHVRTIQMLRSVIEAWPDDQMEAKLAETELGNGGLVVYTRARIGGRLALSD